MNKNGPKPFYISTEPGGLWPDPVPCTLSRLIKIQMDLDQSNVLEALDWSGSIRSIGFGLWNSGPYVFLHFGWWLHLLSCCLSPLPALILLNAFVIFSMGFLAYLWLLMTFFMLRSIKMIGVDFIFILCVLVPFCDLFHAIFLVQIHVTRFWGLAFDFAMITSWWIHLISAGLIFFCFSALFSILLKFNFCDISHFWLILLLDYNFALIPFFC